MGENENVFVSAEGYRMAAREFEQPEQTIFMAVSRWEGCLAAMGAAWGDDSIGAQFAKYYVKGQSDVVKGLHDMMDGVTGIINDLNAMAHNYEKAEESNSR
jgi:hypothetical protein